MRSEGGSLGSVAQEIVHVVESRRQWRYRFQWWYRVHWLVLVSVAVQGSLVVLVSVAVQGSFVGTGFSGGRRFIGWYWFQ